MSLIDKLDAPKSPSWIAKEEGDLIEGEVIGVDSRDAGYGPYPILTLQVTQTIGGVVDDGTPPAPPCTLALHCLGTVLGQEVADVQVGDQIAARFDGQKQGKSGNTYQAWSFASERPSVASKLPPSDAGHADLFKK